MFVAVFAKIETFASTIKAVLGVALRMGLA
jgi:hypothetical protein